MSIAATIINPEKSPLHLVDTTMFWSPSSGGVRRYLLAKQAWLKRRADWRQTIATPVTDSPGMIRIPGWPLPGSGGYRLPINRGACGKVLRALQPDIIEAGDPYRLAWSVLDVAKQLSIPAVAFSHSNLEAMALRAGAPLGAAFSHRTARITRNYVKRLYEQYDLVLAPSRAMRDHLLALGLRNVERQPLGVDCSQFNPALHDPAWRQEFLQSLHLPSETRLLLYIGRFAPEKNLDVLADCVQRLGAPYALLAIGAGPVRPRGERVCVRPYESDRGRLARLLANVDALVHAGDQETFGLAVLEAMASGTPVVARAADGLAELVDDEVGAGVPSLRPEAFAEAVRAVCEGGDGHGARRSLAARQRASSYDWNCVFPPLFARYAALIRGDTAEATMEPDPDQAGNDRPRRPAKTSLT